MRLSHAKTVNTRHSTEVLDDLLKDVKLITKQAKESHFAELELKNSTKPLHKPSERAWRNYLSNTIGIIPVSSQKEKIIARHHEITNAS